MRTLALARCPHCGGTHGAEAHRDIGYALRLADAALAGGNVTEGRMWLRVAMGLRKEGRR